MDKFLAFLLGMGILYFLASLPSYIFYILLGQYMLPLFNHSRMMAFFCFNSFFIVLFFITIWLSGKRHRLH
jgi:hypothetical protein